VASGVALLAAMALAACMLVPAALGYHRYVIAGGSMSGSYDRGSIVFEKPVATGDLGVGDVITYDPPPDAGVAGLVTHRIVAIQRGGRQGLVFRTKGDANERPDPWRFTLDDPTQPRVAFSVPYLGYAFGALAVRWVRMLVIGLPALLIAFSLLARLWREAGEEARAHTAAQASGGGTEG